MVDTSKLAQRLIANQTISYIKYSYNFAYEGQRLNAAIFLIKGCVNLYQKNCLIKEYTERAFIGLEELLLNQAQAYRIQIVENSQIILVTKSEVRL